MFSSGSVFDEDLLKSLEEKVSKEHALYLRRRLREDVDDSYKRVAAYLRVLPSPNAPEEIQIAVKTGINVVGRAGGRLQGIALDVVGVSSIHGIIEVSDDGLEHFVEDLQSTNGMTIGPKGYKLHPNKLYELAHNKLVAFGPASCIYERVNPGKGLGEYSDDEIQDEAISSTMTSNPFSEGSSQIARPTRSSTRTRRIEDSESDTDIEEVENAPLNIPGLPENVLTAGGVGRRKAASSGPIILSDETSPIAQEKRPSPTPKYSHKIINTNDDDDDDDDLIAPSDLFALPTHVGIPCGGLKNSNLPSSPPKSSLDRIIPPTQILSSGSNTQASGIPSTLMVPRSFDDVSNGPFIFDDGDDGNDIMGPENSREVIPTQRVDWGSDDANKSASIEPTQILNTQSQSLERVNDAQQKLGSFEGTLLDNTSMPIAERTAVSPTMRLESPSRISPTQIAHSDDDRTERGSSTSPRDGVRISSPTHIILAPNEDISLAKASPNRPGLGDESNMVEHVDTGLQQVSSVGTLGVEPTQVVMSPEREPPEATGLDRIGSGREISPTQLIPPEKGSVDPTHISVSRDTVISNMQTERIESIDPTLLESSPAFSSGVEGAGVAPTVIVSPDRPKSSGSLTQSLTQSAKESSLSTPLGAVGDAQALAEPDHSESYVAIPKVAEESADRGSAEAPANLFTRMDEPPTDPNDPFWAGETLPAEDLLGAEEDDGDVTEAEEAIDNPSSDVRAITPNIERGAEGPDQTAGLPVSSPSKSKKTVTFGTPTLKSFQQLSMLESDGEVSPQVLGHFESSSTNDSRASTVEPAKPVQDSLSPVLRPRKTPRKIVLEDSDSEPDIAFNDMFAAGKDSESSGIETAEAAKKVDTIKGKEATEEGEDFTEKGKLASLDLERKGADRLDLDEKKEDIKKSDMKLSESAISSGKDTEEPLFPGQVPSHKTPKTTYARRRTLPSSSDNTNATTPMQEPLAEPSISADLKTPSSRRIVRGRRPGPSHSEETPNAALPLSTVESSQLEVVNSTPGSFAVVGQNSVAATPNVLVAGTPDEPHSRGKKRLGAGGRRGRRSSGVTSTAPSEVESVIPDSLICDGATVAEVTPDSTQLSKADAVASTLLESKKEPTDERSEEMVELRPSTGTETMPTTPEETQLTGMKRRGRLLNTSATDPELDVASKPTEFHGGKTPRGRGARAKSAGPKKVLRKRGKDEMEGVEEDNASAPPAPAAAPIPFEKVEAPRKRQRPSRYSSSSILEDSSSPLTEFSDDGGGSSETDLQANSKSSTAVTTPAPVSAQPSVIDAEGSTAVNTNASQETTNTQSTAGSERISPDDLWDIGKADLVRGSKRTKKGRASTAKGKKRTVSMVDEEDEEGVSTPVKSAKRTHHATKENTPNISPGRFLGQQKEFKITFTGKDLSSWVETIEDLGGVKVDSWSECTHLVTDKIRRTVKFLAALSTGKYILNEKWLQQSQKERRFVAENKYTVKDKNMEEQFGFSLVESLKLARDPSRQSVFANVHVYATPNVKPPPDELEEMLRAAGGKLLASLPPTLPKDPKDCVVIGCVEDLEECQRLKAAGWPIQSKEFVLTGILRQTLDFTSHLLDLHDEKAAVTTPATSRKRK
ncbi:Mediator of DNA damage checkpoint protein 1 [Dinochytrium kinnereticum]|nr:Mediator of DNA damage checkpoint protein 1 [Dinochytrium kinnereticum]